MKIKLLAERRKLEKEGRREDGAGRWRAGRSQDPSPRRLEVGGWRSRMWKPLEASRSMWVVLF